MARCDSGARSPLAPTEPFSGTTGTTPALSIAVSACSVLTRMPGMAAHQRIDADHQHRPHHVLGKRLTHAHRVGDDQVVLQFLHQAAFGRIADCRPAIRRAARCAPSSLSALLPKPVVTP